MVESRSPLGVVIVAIALVVACHEVFQYQPIEANVSFDADVQGDSKPSDHRGDGVPSDVSTRDVIRDLQSDGSNDDGAPADVKQLDTEAVDQTSPPDIEQICDDCTYIFTINECRITCGGCQLTCSGPLGRCRCGSDCEVPNATKWRTGDFTCGVSTLCNALTIIEQCSR